MNISIIGAGALGKVYGGLLSLCGHEVNFLLRSEYDLIKYQKYFDLYFKELDQTVRIDSPRIYNESSQLPVADLVIICLKTTENKHLDSLLSTTLKPDTLVWIIQNGIGNEEYIEQFCPSQPIVSSISTVAATRKDNARVDIYYLGDLRLASFNQQIDFSVFERLFSGSIKPKISVYDNYKQMRWEKLIWNVPFCTLAVIYDKSCDVLASEKPYEDIVNAMVKEVQAIAASEGVIISDEYIDKTVGMTKKVKNYYPSMYWDFVKQRPIEREYIFDNVLAIAEKNRVATPALISVKQKLDTL